jgi:uncharacterized membrane protein required for colicin V production
VPQIETPLLLDILLGLVIVLFVPFGLRRGVAKEAMVSASIFLGATLAERFGSLWGDELSHRLNLELSSSTFAVSALLLFGSTMLLGYGGGAALGATRPAMLSRLVGGLLAALNAALLLSYLLRWIGDILRQGQTLDDGVISHALVRQTDVFLLGATGVLLVITIIGWIVNAMRSRRQPHENARMQAAGIPARQRPVRLAAAPDAGKYEPDMEQVAPSGRFAPGLDATSPLSGGAPYVAQAVWSDDRPTSRVSNGHNHGAYAGSSSSFQDGAGASPPDETVWAAWNPSKRDAPQTHPEPANQWPVSPSVGVTDDERCAVCHARVGPRDVFCPECGATL